MKFILALAAVAAFVSAAPLEKRAHEGKATYYYQNGNGGLLSC
jgi:hypothetical protein